MCHNGAFRGIRLSVAYSSPLPVIFCKHRHCPSAGRCIPGEVEGLEETSELDGECEAGEVEGLPDGDEVASGEMEADGEAAIKES